MAGSPEEREIRDAVANHARVTLPNARIIHELNVGGCRADLAAVSPDRLILFEIKSQKDTLERLPRQIESFRAAAHAVILVAHEKWFDTAPYNNGSPRFAAPAHLTNKVSETWVFPEPAPTDQVRRWYRWTFPRPTLAQPRAFTMLDLLWRDELMAEASRHRIAVGTRARRADIMCNMAWLMTGKEIAEAVCRQLRQRPFAEADLARSAA